MPKQRYDATKIYAAIQAVVEKRQPKAQVARDAGVFARGADAVARRRDRADPARQQQRLLPGQRDGLV